MAYQSWGTWWAVPLFILYGFIYTTYASSLWHESGHGTAFETPWINNVVYHIASFMSLMQATPWRWSHTRHHTDTIIVGRDPEIAASRPPAWRRIILEIFRLYGGVRDLKRMVMHCFGRLDREERQYIPAAEAGKTFLESRIWRLCSSRSSFGVYMPEASCR